MYSVVLDKGRVCHLSATCRVLITFSLWAHYHYNTP